MARFSVLFLAAVCACSFSATQATNSAALKKVQKAGSALAVTFNKQWTKVLTGQRKSVLVLQAEVLKEQTSAEIKTALSNAFAPLDQYLDRANVLADKLKSNQTKEINGLVQEYLTVLRKLENAKPAVAANDKEVVQLRLNKMKLLTSWENKVIEINREYRTGYLNAFRAASEAAASKPAVRKAIRAAFVRLLSTAVKGQEENITQLTATQFPMVERFALLAGQILVELVVAAQSALL